MLSNDFRYLFNGFENLYYVKKVTSISISLTFTLMIVPTKSIMALRAIIFFFHCF